MGEKGSDQPMLTTTIHSLVAALVMYGVGYPPPSAYDVLDVLQKRYYGVNGGDIDAQIATARHEFIFGDYPVDAIVQHCDPYEIENVNPRKDRRLTVKRGYRCLVEIVPYAVNSFYLSGIFYHTGTNWAYYGLDKRRSIRPQEIINRKNSINSGRTILKPGSLAYDGFPEDPFNDVPSPYDSLLGFEREDSPF